MRGPTAADAFLLCGQGGQAVARMLISLGMTIDFVDNDGNTALDYGVAQDRLEMTGFLTSMGAHVNVNTVNLSNNPAMDALLNEVREEKEARRVNRKRKRNEDFSTEACPDGQRRSAMVSWAYSGTEAEELEILPEDVTVIHENDQVWACVLPEKSTTAAKRIRRSAPRPQEKYWTCLAFVPGTSRDFAGGLHTDIRMNIGILVLARIFGCLLNYNATLKVNGHRIVNIGCTCRINTERE